MLTPEMKYFFMCVLVNGTLYSESHCLPSQRIAGAEFLTLLSLPISDVALPSHIWGPMTKKLSFHSLFYPGVLHE